MLPSSTRSTLNYPYNLVPKDYTFHPDRERDFLCCSNDKNHSYYTITGQPLPERKMRVIMSNPHLFRIFKKCLVQSKRTYSLVDTTSILHAFFNELKMTDIADEIKQEQKRRKLRKSRISSKNDFSKFQDSSLSSVPTSSSKPQLRSEYVEPNIPGLVETKPETHRWSLDISGWREPEKPVSASSVNTKSTAATAESLDTIGEDEYSTTMLD